MPRQHPPFCSLLFLSSALLLLGGGAASAPDPRAILGRWDLTVHAPDGDYPSWLEVERSGRTTVGYFVGRTGSVRPISRVEFQEGRVRFSLPVQFERGDRDLEFDGQLNEDRLSGSTVTSEGKRLEWTGVRAPALKGNGEADWGEPVELLNRKDLAGWRARDAGRPNSWRVEDGLLRNGERGNDLLSEKTYRDFRLHAELRYPKGSNSGIYLRGRYEVQIEDDYGRDPDSHGIAGVYGFLSPRANPSRPAGEWQTLDIALVGRRVTIVFNGDNVVDRQEIPGITGGALDSREGEPGPILIQGDHGAIDFRRIAIQVPR